MHLKGIPVLVCPQFLRSRGCGQVDVAILEYRRSEWFLRVCEAKTSLEASCLQRRRLRASVDLVAKILNVPGTLEEFYAQDYLPKPGQVLNL